MGSTRGEENGIPSPQLADIIRPTAPVIARRENHGRSPCEPKCGGATAVSPRPASRQIQLPKGYGVPGEASLKKLERARHRLSYVMPVTVAIIFVLLFWAFHSATYAGLALLNVPFSAAGGLWRCTCAAST